MSCTGLKLYHRRCSWSHIGLLTLFLEDTTLSISCLTRKENNTSSLSVVQYVRHSLWFSFQSLFWWLLLHLKTYKYHLCYTLSGHVLISQELFTELPEIHNISNAFIRLHAYKFFNVICGIWNKIMLLSITMYMGCSWINGFF